MYKQGQIKRFLYLAWVSFSKLVGILFFDYFNDFFILNFVFVIHLFMAQYNMVLHSLIASKTNFVQIQILVAHLQHQADPKLS